MSAEIGPISDRVPSEPRRIGEETREKLKRRGYVVYGLTGDTLENILGEDSISSLRDEDLTRIMDGRSYSGDVAVRPGKMRGEPLSFLLSTSDAKFAQWRDRSTDRTARIAGFRFSGTTAISGNAATFAALAKAHFEATGELLFNTDYYRNPLPYSLNDYAVTTDQLSSGLVAVGFSKNRRQSGRLDMDVVRAANPRRQGAVVKHMPLIVAR